MLRPVFLILCVIYTTFGEDVYINLPSGPIRGETVLSSVTYNTYYYTYQGIPYAAPPVGKLRFQPPQPVTKWNTTLNAWSAGYSCHQTPRDIMYASEDCLYLNVITPVSASNGTNNKLGVLVFIHGGTFTQGHMSSDTLKGFFMEENIIVVDFNYRLGALGFLSTEDTVIPGNMGLKDQQFVLKWVKENIHLFGGDPEKITLMGFGAGAASVNYHMMSPGSAGLFGAAIVTSGSALCDWSLQRNASETAYEIAAALDLSFNKDKSSEELLTFLQSVDFRQILGTGLKYRDLVPVIEVPNENAIITELVYDNAANGKFNKVPTLIGISSEESLQSTRDISWQVKSWDENPALLVNEDMGITDTDIKQKVGELIKDIYVNGSSFEKNVEKGVQFSSDDKYTRGIIKFAELISKHVDTYFYQFSYFGLIAGGKLPIKGIGKVSHGDDQRYLWSYFGDYSVYPNEDVIALRRYVRLISNFVKYFNPTPANDELIEVTWPTITNDHFYYLDIDKELTVQEDPRDFSYKKWVEIYENYAQKPYTTF